MKKEILQKVNAVLEGAGYYITKTYVEEQACYTPDPLKGETFWSETKLITLRITAHPSLGQSETARAIEEALDAAPALGSAPSGQDATEAQVLC